MARLNPEHFFDQADRLVSAPPSGRPRQIDLRRAVSAAYYGLFHFCMSAVADAFVGATRHATDRYALVYRGVDHRTLKDVCAEARKQTPSARYALYAPPSGFGADIQAFATAAIELQEQRIAADYDPQRRLRASDAKLLIATARNAIQRSERAGGEPRATLLAFPPR